MTHATHENAPVCQTCGGDGITGYQPGPHPASEIDVPCPDCAMSLTETPADATCRNCGRVKVLSRPCGFDHLAAILEFNATRAKREARP